MKRKVKNKNKVLREVEVEVIRSSKRNYKGYGL